MKKIILTMILAGLFSVGCSKRKEQIPPIISADVQAKYKQEYDYTQKEFGSVFVEYTIKNDGNVDISRYTVYFTAIDYNENEYKNTDTGACLAVGAEANKTGYIDVEGKEIKQVLFSAEYECY